MRFTFKKPNRSYEDLSAPSSFRSVDSYDVFGSAGSDLTDCEYCEDRRYQKRYYRTPVHSSASTSVSNSFRSAMDRAETKPLLKSAAPVPYSTIEGSSSDSLGPGDLSSSAILCTYKKQFEKPQPVRTQSSLITIFSVWNTIMGSSLLTMAWGVERAGLPAALLLFVFMASLCLYTAYVLICLNSHHGGGACEVPALCRSLLGRWAELIAHGFSLLALLGANIVYWILITNFLYFTVNYLGDLSTSNTTDYNSTLLCPNQDGLNGSLILPATRHEQQYWGLHTTVPIYVAAIVFPLLNFKDVSFFTRFNSLGTLSVVYLLIFVVVKSATWGINISAIAGESRAGTDAAVLSGMLALSYYIHNIIITVMSNNARQDKNGRDLTIAFVLVAVTYTLVGALFYICFPLAKSCIEDNMLNNFDMHDVMTAVARVLLLFQVVTVYPLIAFMLRSEAILLLPIKEEYKYKQWLPILINLSIVTMCILVACFCPNIGFIIRYTGAVSGLVHVFALPSLLQVRSLQLRGKLTCWKFILFALIILFGVVNLLMQFFIQE